MWIHDTNAPTHDLRVPGMSEEYDTVDIPESDSVAQGGVVQVDEQTGEALIEHCPTITEHD